MSFLDYLVKASIPSEQPYSRTFEGIGSKCDPSLSLQGFSSAIDFHARKISVSRSCQIHPSLAESNSGGFRGRLDLFHRYLLSQASVG